jgi:hypothetical protein
VRLEAVTALARTLPPADFRALGARIRKDALETIRLQLVVELSDAGDPAGIAEIEPLLTDAAWRVASAAAAAIGSLGVAEDQPKLEPLTTNKSWQIRAAAFEGLGRLRAAKAIPLLAEGLADKDPIVKGVCHANLQILSRETGPDRRSGATSGRRTGRGRARHRAGAAPPRRRRPRKAKEYGNQQTKDGGVEILQKAPCRHRRGTT